MSLIPRICEGRAAKYVTGSGESVPTADRVHIYRVEGGHAKVSRLPRQRRKRVLDAPGTRSFMSDLLSHKKADRSNEDNVSEVPPVSILSGNPKKCVVTSKLQAIYTLLSVIPASLIESANSKSIRLDKEVYYEALIQEHEAYRKCIRDVRSILMNSGSLEFHQESTMLQETCKRPTRSAGGNTVSVQSTLSSDSSPVLENSPGVVSDLLKNICDTPAVPISNSDVNISRCNSSWLEENRLTPQYERFREETSNEFISSALPDLHTSSLPGRLLFIEGTAGALTPQPHAQSSRSSHANNGLNESKQISMTRSFITDMALLPL